MFLKYLILICSFVSVGADIDPYTAFQVGYVSVGIGSASFLTFKSVVGYLHAKRKAKMFALAKKEENDRLAVIKQFSDLLSQFKDFSAWRESEDACQESYQKLFSCMKVLPHASSTNISLDTIICIIDVLNDWACHNDIAKKHIEAVGGLTNSVDLILTEILIPIIEFEKINQNDVPPMIGDTIGIPLDLDHNGVLDHHQYASQNLSEQLKHYFQLAEFSSNEVWSFDHEGIIYLLSQIEHNQEYLKAAIHEARLLKNKTL